ncbi:MAG: hypothetical protein EXX96DRAFT_585835 [Benjaminiella poitrasii]|nr:MAG: hypothetical protein EXX96DRAFT_585835 [Benjaminiella poitrasii]
MFLKKSLKCPSCYAESKQVYITEEENIVKCEKCNTSYLHNPTAEKPKINPDLFSDMSDDDSVYSDDYQPSDASDDKRITKRKDAKGKQRKDLGFFSDVDSDDSETSNKKLIQKRKYTSVPSDNVSQKKTHLADDKKNDRAIFEFEFSDSEDDTPVGEEEDFKMPAIFSDNYSANTGSPSDTKAKKGASHNDDPLKLDFSEMEDESDFDDVSIKPRAPAKSKAKPSKRQARKNKESDYSSPSDSSDSETEKLQMYDPKKKYNKKSTTRVSGSVNPLGRFNPYIVFNQMTRAKIAESNPSANPLEISRLVAKAWQSLGEEQKKKFREGLEEKRTEINSRRKNQKKRPAGNGYILFSKEELPRVRTEYPDIASINDLSSIVGIRWKGLQQEERERYHEIAKKERDEWIKNNPEEHQKYMDTMVSKIKATKRKQREKKQRQN